MSQKQHSSIGIHHPANGMPRGVSRLRLLGRMQRYALLTLGVLAIGAAIVLGMRMAKARDLDETARAQSTRYVIVTNPKAASGDNLLRLPGTLQGFVEAPIYARVGGYLAHWYKDIGDPVEKGELLAQLEVPEVAQQLNEALAAQRQTATNLQLAESTFDRWEALRKRDAVTQQEYDEKRNALASARAAAASSLATVTRLQEQVGFGRITAPFSGIVTRRNIDVGNLVDAGSGTKVLFTLAKNDRLRVYIYVPQNYAAQIRIGDKADIVLKEMPGRKFAGTVVRTAKAIDPLSRTLQVEVNLPNIDGTLLPGAYVEVGIRTRGAEAGKTLTVPGNTLLFRPEGLRVGVVDAAGKVHLQPVTISREMGIEVELSSGVSTADRIILNPPDALAEGDTVNVTTPPAAAPPAPPLAPPAPTTTKPAEGKSP
ncbi:MAG TPA: efflux RND transporter periplasmic adaptor subunit [Usitatibacteraceae bacterium]